MALTNSAQPATYWGTRRMGSQFAWSDSRAMTAPSELPLSEPHMWHSLQWLNARIRELVAADRQKDESLAILLHELRSPLASIQNAIAALRIGSKDESFQQQMHDLVERQVRQIALLTTSLCQSRGSRLENPRIERERIDLCTVLSRATETVTPEITQRRHQISLGLPGSSIWILGDARRLEEVFVNLLTNASKYSDVGDRVSMSVYVSDGHAVIEVCDSGIGIAADLLPHIFDLFVRGDTIAVRTRPGLGIGLAVVRSIVNSHCGTVSASSAGIGQGSKFTVRLQLDS